MKNSKKVSNCWKLIGWSLAASCLLATSVVAPLSSNKNQIKKQNSNNKSQKTKSSQSSLITSNFSTPNFDKTFDASSVFSVPEGEDAPTGSVSATITTSGDINYVTFECSGDNDVEGTNLIMNSTFVDDGTTYTVSAINPSAFSTDDTSCIFSGSLTLPNTLTSIGDKAFYCHNNLFALDLSQCVKLEKIGDWAFGDSEISDIDFSGCTNLKTIGNQAFSENSLKNIRTPNDQGKWGYNDTFVTHTFLDESNATAGKMICYSSDNYMPVGSLAYGNIKLDSVTSVKNSSFCGCETLKSVDFTNSPNLTSIGDNAFQSCHILTAVNISNCNKLNYVGGSAFDKCHELKAIDLSNCSLLDEIGTNAFAECDALSSINLANCNNITTIGDDCFYACPLTEIITPGDSGAAWGSSKQYQTRVQYNSFNEVVGKIVEANDTSFVPIGKLAYGEIKFDNTLTTVGGFECCKGLTGADFSSCTTLDNIAYQCFYECTNLTNVSFSQCTNLKQINQGAFSYCESLNSINFSQCTNLLKIDYAAFTSAGLIQLDLSDCTKLQTIGEEAFSYCEKLSYVDLSQCTILNSISTSSFTNCPLSEIKTPCDTGSGGYWGDTSQFYTRIFRNDDGTIIGKLIEDKDNAYTPLAGLAYGDIKLENVASLNENQFESCCGITNVDFSLCKSLNVIPSNAFKGCEQLESIDLSQCESLEKIASGGFSDCTNLSSITFGNSLNTIDKEAFERCQNITNINTPADSIGGGAWGKNNEFYTRIFTNSNNEVTGKIIEANNTPYIPVSIGLVYGSIDLTSSKITTMDPFFAFSSITSVILPNSLTSIGDYAFGDCPKLTNIDFSRCDELEYIGGSAFQFSNIQNIDLSNSTKLKTILKGAFCDCQNLSSIILPDSHLMIENNAFGSDDTEAANLKSITFSWSDPKFMNGLAPNWYNVGDTSSQSLTFYVPNGDYTAFDAYARANCLWYDPTTMHFEGGSGPTPPSPSTNDLNLGIALGVSLGTCVGIPGIIGLGFLIDYKSKEKKQNKQE